MVSARKLTKLICLTAKGGAVKNNTFKYEVMYEYSYAYKHIHYILSIFTLSPGRAHSGSPASANTIVF